MLQELKCLWLGQSDTMIEHTVPLIHVSDAFCLMPAPPTAPRSQAPSAHAPVPELPAVDFDGDASLARSAPSARRGGGRGRQHAAFAPSMPSPSKVIDRDASAPRRPPSRARRAAMHYGLP